MLYEYPEEFVVSVIYVKDLKNDFADRDNKFEFSATGGFLKIPENEIEEYELFSEKGNTIESIVDINLNDIGKEDPGIQEQEALGKFEHYNPGNIFISIDDEYANNETD